VGGTVNFLVTSPPLDIKGGVEAPLEDKKKKHNTIDMSNTRTQDIGLLSFGSSEPV
jgi:hypothetical protein